MKLTPKVNYINILCKSCLYVSKLSSFSLVTFCFVIFANKILYEKGALKKLTPGFLENVLVDFHDDLNISLKNTKKKFYILSASIPKTNYTPFLLTRLPLMRLLVNRTDGVSRYPDSPLN